jgi:nitroreductase
MHDLSTKAARTTVPIHPLLAARFSPRAFDQARAVTDDELIALFEAARWAPSSGNAQPWRFIVGRLGDSAHARIVETLSRGNRNWAPRAPVLLLAITQVVRDDGSPARHAAYDLGQSVAHLTFQAAALGLAVHQMAGFSVEAARAAFGVPERYEPFTVVALGAIGDPSWLPDDLRERELSARRRRSLAETVFSGRFGARR